MKIKAGVFAFIFAICAAMVSTIAILSAGQTAAAAPEAQQAKVWVNLNSKVYHCPGTRYYGNTAHGEYRSEADAEAKGYRAAYGKRCGETKQSSAKSNASPSGPVALKGTDERTAPVDDPTVWVNTSSKVYHCAGTRYYGTTKRGAYMKQSEAERVGNRPAGGKSCN